MRKLHYCWVDVFTDRLFGGNQLAVFLDAQGLSGETMQKLAREMNLSETTFVLPAQQPEHTYQVRIFTPAAEMPMAGHPTVGTAFTLAHEGLIQLSGTETSITFEEKVGLIPIKLVQAGNVQTIQMQQPLPNFGEQFMERAALAKLLSLELADLMDDLPCQVISCGVPFLFVPVKTLAAIQSIRFRLDVWEGILRNFAAPNVYAFTLQAERPGSTVHGRMFAPTLGLAEDPATGAANGPLGCYLVRHKMLPTAASTEITSEQGFEMGRPSIIQIKIEQENGKITGVFVGGQCRFVGRGEVELPEGE
ncbi:PhzF family phenazine biosynthesis protein [Ktedonosporobacter rubrisoli]|uniref:PhzF family phenazine biosynthesis protein n=1 Tax=Ktedonosporobacter rubrisoli TaxID=2509675 RepID=A0A4P6JI08_KTERU|nr:PhzF family phenazine biosynthesis protein [Ktedonosporobacter rubrisoli]QBD74500.1 PhzF family phenazine biosynthesis protein [Ktedonosporobacter rubrisoli]